MSVVDDPSGSDSPTARPAATATVAARKALPTRTLLLACLPAIVVGLLIRAWVLRTPLLTMNSDEAVTGLQALEVLHGHFRLVVAGNDYGSTTETFLAAPLLAVWSGMWPLRILTVLLSAVAAYALYRLAEPFFGRTAAAAVTLIGWTTSGAFVILWLRPYMGYPTGFIAQVAALALACHAMRTTQRLARTAFLAGLAAGFAIWSHPMFGAVALLALITPSLYRWRALRSWWLCLVAGGLIGVSPWLVFIAGKGKPESALATVLTTYSERLQNFVTQLLPRAFGLRAPDGSWVGPAPIAVVVAIVLIGGALTGMVLLVIRRGAPAVPVLVAGVLAFPVLAVFPPLGFVADARYALPFVPQLLIGLGAWLLLFPVRFRESAWLVVVLPTVWAVALCVPVLHQQAGWALENPDWEAEQVVDELAQRNIHDLGGEYWGTYLVDYLADGSVSSTTDGTVRFAEESDRVRSADPHDVALIYSRGLQPNLELPPESYDVVQVGKWDLYLPKATLPGS